MGIRVDRKTLKGYFRKGATPKGEEFENLIESILNLKDDDIVHFENDHSPVFIKKAEKNGGTILEVYQKQEGSALAVLQWKIDLDSKGKLSVKPKDSTDGIIELSPSKEIKIRGDVSVDKLTVKGEFIAEKGISVKGDFTAEKVLTVKGVLSAEKGMILKGNLEIYGNINFTNELQNFNIEIKPGHSVVVFKWPSISDLDVFEIKVTAKDYLYRAFICILTDNNTRRMIIADIELKTDNKKGIRQEEFQLIMRNCLEYTIGCNVNITKIH